MPSSKTEIENDRLLSLGEAVNIIPTGTGKPASASTLWRWCRKGLKGERLKYLRAGGRICVTKKDMLEFFERLAAKDDAPLSTSPSPRRDRPRSEKQRAKDVDSAMAELDAAGI